MIPDKVNICGITHRVIKCEDNFDIDLHLGQIDYPSATIKINCNACEEMQMQALFHEMLHGILIQIGRNEESQDECFVQSLSNALHQSFQIKEGE